MAQSDSKSKPKEMNLIVDFRVGSGIQHHTIKIIMEKGKALIKLLNTAFNGKKVMAATELLTDEYIQHNLMSPYSKGGFLLAIHGFCKMFFKSKMVIRGLFADADVVGHSHY